MSSDLLPLPIASEADLQQMLERPDSVSTADWADVVSDVWLALKESCRLYGYEGVLIITPTGGGYKAYTGFLTDHDDVDADDVNLNLIGGGREEETKRIPPLPLVEEIAYVSSISESTGLQGRLSGEGKVTVTPESGVNIVDDDAIALTLDPTADVTPSHKTEFHVITDDRNWKVWRFDEDDDFELHPSLADRVFVDEYPSRTHYCVYLNEGDLAHVAIPEHHHEQIIEEMPDEERYVTPTHPQEGVAYHPCRVVHTDATSVSVRLLGVEDDVRSFTDGELSSVLEGKLLPAPRSEQSFGEEAFHE